MSDADERLARGREARARKALAAAKEVFDRQSSD